MWSDEPARTTSMSRLYRDRTGTCHEPLSTGAKRYPFGHLVVSCEYDLWGGAVAKVRTGRPRGGIGGRNSVACCCR
jgi:hypothetical protein